MKHLSPLIAAAVWLAGCAAVEVNAQADHAPPREKKLIKFGWDSPKPAYVRSHIREMEEQPFEGIRLAWENDSALAMFRPTREDEGQLEQFYDDLANIQWGRFTDNFIGVITGDYGDPRMDWFDDDHWAAALHNTRLAAKAARVGRCVGLAFDPEDYGTGLWSYPRAVHRDTQTFEQYQAKVRQRGADWVRAVQDELPDAKVLFLFFPDTAPTRAQLSEKLPDMNYGLFPAFLNGVIEAAGPDIELIDGDESAYYYGDPDQYLRAYHATYQGSLTWVDPALHVKYRRHVRAGSSTYIDWYFPLGERKRVATFLTPEQQRTWVEHNTYWSLHTTDEYVWVWTERWRWWQGEAPPESVNDAMRSASERIRHGQPFDVEFSPVFHTAAAELDRQIEQGSRPREAEIHRISGDQPPVIDGDLTDRTWHAIEPLDAFEPPALFPPLPVGTRAWAAYDDDCLYLAFECGETDLDKLRIWDEGRDHGDLWRGDVVEILIGEPGGTVPFHHFMVNPAGGYWDSRGAMLAGRPHEDMSYDPEWRRAAVIGDGAWHVEVAIPWQSLGMEAPSVGDELRANLCRHRHQGDTHNALWSPSVKSFQEPDRFGTWTFR